MINLSRSILPMLVCILGLGAFETHSSPVKNSCIREYPVAKDEMDDTLVQLFQQLCSRETKNNPELKRQYQVQVSKRLIEIGQNFKALNFITELQSQGINDASFTDTTFRAGVNIANQAMNQMRANENRRPNIDDFPHARVLSDNIRSIQPIVLQTEPVIASSHASKKTIKTTARKNVKTTVSQPPIKFQKNLVKTKTSASNTVPARKPETVATRPIMQSSNPFGSLNNN